MDPLKIEPSADGQWQNKIYGDNGENLHTSETYTRKHDAERGFYDLADRVLIALAQRGKLKSSMERLDLLKDLAVY
jgi:hypothetical protein